MNAQRRAASGAESALATLDLPFVDDSPSGDEQCKCPGKVSEHQERTEPPLTFIEQICRLPDQLDSVPFYVRQETESGSEQKETQQQSVQPPEILVAYMSGQPEAVAAIELLREAQRVWDRRKRTPSPEQQQHHVLSLPVERTEQRRYSHEDLRINDSTLKVSPPVSKQRQQYRRRPSSQAECLSAQRHQKNRKRASTRPEQLSPCTVQSKKEMTARLKSARGSVDVMSQAMSNQSRRSSSIPESACLKVEAAAAAGDSGGGGGAGSRRPSHHRAGAVDAADGMLPLGTDAASFYKEQRRRASSRASAIFLVSPSSKETQLVPEDEDDGTPEGRRRRRTISIIATVGAFLLVLSILLVTVTLRLATHIDDLVRKENEQQSSSSAPSTDYGLGNATTPLTPPADRYQRLNATMSSIGIAASNHNVTPIT